MNDKDYDEDYDYCEPVLSCDICKNPITENNQGFCNLGTTLCIACTEMIAKRLKEVGGLGSDEPIIVEE